jgi:orotate phosphoribosyltransferase
MELPAADRQALAAILARVSYEERPVTLASGRKSDFYLDGRQTTLHPEGLFLAGRLMLDVVRAAGVQAIGGPTLGADPLVSAVAVLSHLLGEPLPAFIIRKEAKSHGTGQWVEGARNVPDGARVAILEDTVTTGGSLLKAAHRAEQSGWKVACVVSLVDREEGGIEAVTKAGYDYHPLLKISEVRDALR